jgi:microsomal prostaglandin-E synthase 2
MNTVQKPKLFQYAVCPFCQKVDAILAYKKVPFEAVEVHPLNKKEIGFSENYKKVPIYIDQEGRQINDSTPIMRNIDSTYPDRPVFETDQAAKAKEDQWLKWSDEVLVSSLPPLVYRNIKDACKAFGYIANVGKFSPFQKMAIKYSGAVVMTMVAKKSAKKKNIADPVRHFKNCLTEWEKALEGGKYLNGHKANGADLAVFGILKSIRNLPAFKYVEENQTVYEWYQRIENDVNCN